MALLYAYCQLTKDHDKSEIYSHVEIMYECRDYGQGFTFKSQYKSYHKVHVKHQEFLCFKPKCEQQFKCESKLNAHLCAHTKQNWLSVISETTPTLTITMYVCMCTSIVINYHSLVHSVAKTSSGKKQKICHLKTYEDD